MRFKNNSEMSRQRTAAWVVPAVFLALCNLSVMSEPELLDQSFPITGFEQAAYASGLYPVTAHDVPTPTRYNSERPIASWGYYPQFSMSQLDGETLWLARCIYSETTEPAEMELVAWVVRNRVETRYRGKATYRDVILDPYQFSAFNPELVSRQFYLTLGPESEIPGWEEAMRIAYMVKTDDGRRRPFTVTTRHFYSEMSMVGRRRPYWAKGTTPIKTESSFEVNERRFRFFDGVS